MKNLLNLLERFSKILDKDQVLKESIQKIIKENTQVSLSTEKINLKEGVLEINTSPAAKNEINLKEEIIKFQLKEIYQISITRIIYK